MSWSLSILRTRSIITSYRISANNCFWPNHSSWRTICSSSGCSALSSQLYQASSQTSCLRKLKHYKRQMRMINSKNRLKCKIIMWLKKQLLTRIWCLISFQPTKIIARSFHTTKVTKALTDKKNRKLYLMVWAIIPSQLIYKKIRRWKNLDGPWGKQHTRSQPTVESYSTILRITGLDQSFLARSAAACSSASGKSIGTLKQDSLQLSSCHASSP